MAYVASLPSLSFSFSLLSLSFLLEKESARMVGRRVRFSLFPSCALSVALSLKRKRRRQARRPPRPTTLAPPPSLSLSLSLFLCRGRQSARERFFLSLQRERERERGQGGRTVANVASLREPLAVARERAHRPTTLARSLALSLFFSTEGERGPGGGQWRTRPPCPLSFSLCLCRERERGSEGGGARGATRFFASLSL